MGIGEPAAIQRPVKVLRVRETCARTGLSDDQLKRMEDAGVFPKRFKLNPNGGKFSAAGHLEHEVEAVLLARAAAARNPAQR
jgi:predicted DNA-binding transcriptional regulator AlpA